MSLPAAVATERGLIRSRPSASTTSTATPTAAATPAAASTATATVAGHLGQTRIDLLLGLCEHVDEVTSLLVVWSEKSATCLH